VDSGDNGCVEPALLGIILTPPKASPLPLGGLHEQLDWMLGLRAAHTPGPIATLHPSTRKVLVKYLQQRKRLLEGCASPYVFTSGTGNRLDKGDVHRTFYLLSRQVGLRGPTASRGPRLHDFRHRTGACACDRALRSLERSTILGNRWPSVGSAVLVRSR